MAQATSAYLVCRGRAVVHRLYAPPIYQIWYRKPYPLSASLSTSLLGNGEEGGVQLVNPCLVVGSVSGIPRRAKRSR